MRLLRSIRRAVVAVMGCVAVGALVSGCSVVGSGGHQQPGSSPSQVSPQQPFGSPSSSEPIRSCPAPAPATVTTSAGSLPDGDSFGFIYHFDGTDLYVDPAEYFTGKDAVQAARADGELSPGEDLPDPFYIRNKDATLFRVPVSDGFVATVLDNQVAKRGLTAAKFAELYCESAHDTWLYSDPERLPMHLRVSDGRAVKAEEQYLP